MATVANNTEEDFPDDIVSLKLFVLSTAVGLALARAVARRCGRRVPIRRSREGNGADAKDSWNASASMPRWRERLRRKASIPAGQAFRRALRGSELVVACCCQPGAECATDLTGA